MLNKTSWKNLPDSYLYSRLRLEVKILGARKALQLTTHWKQHSGPGVSLSRTLFSHLACWIGKVDILGHPDEREEDQVSLRNSQSHLLNGKFSLLLKYLNVRRIFEDKGKPYEKECNKTNEQLDNSKYAPEERMDVLKLVRIFFAERTITRNKGRQHKV